MTNERREEINRMMAGVAGVDVSMGPRPVWYLVKNDHRYDPLTKFEQAEGVLKALISFSVHAEPVRDAPIKWRVYSWLLNNADPPIAIRDTRVSASADTFSEATCLCTLAAVMAGVDAVARAMDTERVEEFLQAKGRVEA